MSYSELVLPRHVVAAGKDRVGGDVLPTDPFPQPRGTTMKLLMFLTAMAAAVTVAVIAIGGGSSYTASGSSASASGSARTPASAPGATIGLRQTALGRILVDAKGRTLYLFEADRTDRSACSGSCTVLWPPVTSAGAPVPGRGLDPTQLGTIPGEAGKRQVTYAGHPLYTYAADQKAGDVMGQGLDQFGAKWYVLGQRGTKIDKD